MLEIGGGLGVLSEHLAERVRARPRRRDRPRAGAGAARRARPVRATRRCTSRDAMTLDLAALRPGADEGRREPARTGSRPARSCARSRSCRRRRAGSRWCSRRSASGSPRAPGSGAYGVPSVIAQLACEVRVLRPVSRTVFFPVPNVDSVLVGLERRGPARAGRRCARSCRRRSRTAARRSRARSRSPPARSRGATSVRAALEAIGEPGRRARRAARAGATCASCGRRSGREARARSRPARSNLCLFLGGTRADGLHELVSVIEPLSLADELTLEPLPGGALAAAAPGVGDAGCAAGADEVVCPGVAGPNLAGEALAACRAATGWDGPPVRLTIAQARAGRGRHGRRLGRRGGGAAARRARRRASRRRAVASSRRGSAPTCRRSSRPARCS